MSLFPAVTAAQAARKSAWEEFLTLQEVGSPLLTPLGPSLAGTKPLPHSKGKQWSLEPERGAQLGASFATDFEGRSN